METKTRFRSILCIDLKSFYASCECVARGYDPFQVSLAVVGRIGESGSIVLAVSPALKRQGAKSRCRVYELEGYQNVWFVPCRMNHYLKVSQDILKIYLRYVSYEDLHIYSIDEVFIDITSYLRLYKCDAYTLAKQMMCDILKETGIPSTCGIGPNLLLAKVALDIEAKKAVNGIAQWSYTDVKTKLWPLTPLSKMWGIGIQLEKRLNRMGMYCVGDIAQYPLDFLKREFGVLGEQLYQHSHGIDESDLHDVYQSRYPTIGGGQVLMRDYYAYDIKTILLEQVEEVMFRLRKKNLYCEVVHLAIGYSKSVRGGFSRQTKLSQATDLTESVFEACLRLFEANYTGQPIRKVSISLGGLVERGQTQLSLFEDVTKKQRLSYAMDEIRIKHGKNALLRAISYEKGATGRYRNTLMGGHQAE
ncbi:Y-family DNA polymerase [Turicibacter sanguinis]|uniref:Y-family DNA polymerase n=1 Tax=Turicibacter sanguinis TaxID=154288 RepID=UPI0021D4A4DA|nr:Y-family DNA polymerase [Turicibacter sanguinis]MCU7197449.1 Y-family DNA polymerase [Turicibacter sanguinis]